MVSDCISRRFHLLFGTAAVALALGQRIERRLLPQASQANKTS
jgi:hypothetical protein